MEVFDASKIRNAAIIAHVDHGKTTLVDAILRQSGIFPAHQRVAPRVLDSNVLERERGITILAKNVSVCYRGVKINLVDTPGHADFGGEVERILSMVDGALLVVDAVEGPMPQTRFVLEKALSRGLAPIVVVNKIDRPAADPSRVADQVFDLFSDLGASDQQLDFPVIYASGLLGISAERQPLNAGDQGSIFPLLQAIIEHVPAPRGQAAGPLKMLISNLGYDEYLGRIALGRITNGELRAGLEVLLTHAEKTEVKQAKIAGLFTFEGLKMVPVERVCAGDIAAFSGIEEIEIGETLNQMGHPLPLPSISVDQPTLTVVFQVNDGPLAAQESRFVTSRQLRERLFGETRINLALQVEELETPDKFRVSGRGELHLSVLVETMRREGYTFCVSKPEPVLRRTEHSVLEPYEILHVNVPQEYSGSVIELAGSRGGQLREMDSGGAGRVQLEFLIPSRGLLGFAARFLTETRGNGVMYYAFSQYRQWAGEINLRQSGSMISLNRGLATAYALAAAEQRGSLFITPGTPVYAGMIIGECNRAQDLEINATRKKQMSNIRAAGSDELIKLSAVRELSLEEYLAHLAADECLEVTPAALRLRKISLDRQERERRRKKK